MRRISLLLAIVAACSGESGDGVAFQLKTEEVVVQPGQEMTHCIYTHSSNKEPVLVNRWLSKKPYGIHHVIVFQNPSGIQPPDGTVDQTDCGLVGTSMPIWTYETTDVDFELNLPTDDGNGLPLAQPIAPNTAMYLSVHYINPTDTPLPVHFDLKAFSLPENTDYTPTAAFVTYNNSISIPPGARNDVETATCAPPPGAKFWLLSTHSHKQTVRTEIRDGSKVVFQSNDWEHPGWKQMDSSSFYTFTNPMTWECEYNNIGANSSKTVLAGPSAAINEMCMETGFFFPATKPGFCVWDTTIPGNCGCTLE